MKILVMEYQQTDRFILEKTLGSSYDLVLFGSTEEALNYAAVNSIDIALINLHLLNYYDGIPFLPALRDCSYQSFTAIALITELTKISFDKIMHAGFDATLLSPVSRKSFEETLMNKL